MFHCLADCKLHPFGIRCKTYTFNIEMIEFFFAAIFVYKRREMMYLEIVVGF